MKTVIIIPARYGSTRFPGKPLALLRGEAVIVHVARAALQVKGADAVCVATDDKRIADAVRAHFADNAARVIMTGECRTGTDRLAQAIAGLDTDDLTVVNVQGDEPFINPRHIELLIEAMHADSSLQMATLATPLPSHLTHDTNVVKVVCAQNGNALYFSRLPIPFARDDESETVPRLRHLGVYAYTAKWLLEMANLPSTPLEDTEKLEQLRALENGIALRVVTVENVVDIAIDTPEDLQRAEEFLLTTESTEDTEALKREE